MVYNTFITNTGVGCVCYTLASTYWNNDDGGVVITDDNAIITDAERPNSRIVGPLNIIAAAMPMDWSMASAQGTCDTCQNNWYDDECDCSPSFEIVLESPSYESSLESIYARPKRANNKTRKYGADNNTNSDEDVTSSTTKHNNKRKKNDRGDPSAA